MGPPGSCTDVLGRELAKRYNVPHVSFDDVITEQKNSDTPTGQLLREKLAECEAAAANPKAPVLLLPASLTVKVVEEALSSKPCRWRGFVLSGFPQSMEEATELFLEDAPPPPPDPAAEADAKGKKGKKEEAPPPEKVLRPDYAPQGVALVAASEEACLARLQAGDKPEDQWLPLFKRQFERWQKEFPEGAPAAKELFATKCNADPVVVAEEPPAEAEAAEVEAAEAAESAPGGEDAPGEAAAEDAPAYIVDAVSKLCSRLEAGMQVNNFLPPLEEPATEVTAPAAEVEQSTAAEGEARRKEEETRKKREQEERLEQIKKDELVRLEKHSEPLRQYLMSFVVPTVTSGLVEVCRAQPDDPVGYLAEYLSVYSQLARRKLGVRRQSLTAVTAPSAS
uniref:Adenylate kinase n=1 Tax=Zooxanthella nutricula TaxID=1333877 RepID=A0A7S2JJY1_9DINO